MHPYALLASGKYRDARREYEARLEVQPEDPVYRAELACALAGEGRLAAARECLQGLPTGIGHAEHPALRARRLTAEAWIRSWARADEESGALLQQAVEADPTFEPAVVSLSRDLMWRKRDPEEAKRILLSLKEGGARTLPWHLSLVGVEAARKDLRAAARAAAEGLAAHPDSMKLRLAAPVARLAATPRSGMLAVIVVAVVFLVPYFGPALWAILVGASSWAAVALRRISPRLTSAAIVYAVAWSALMGLRMLAFGRVFP